MAADVAALTLLDVLAGAQSVTQAKAAPPVPSRQTIEPVLAEHLEGNAEIVRELAGQFGDGSNAAVRWIDLYLNGFASPLTGLPSISALMGAVGPAGPTGPAGTITPDPTAPPSVTSLAAIAGLTQIIITWDVPSYTQGHGPGQTNIYIVKKAASDATLPTYPGDAYISISAPHALGIVSFPCDLSTRCHIWAKYQTKDGYVSASPAGGVNGVIAQTGKINNVDLGDLIVTSEKLSQGTYPNINLVSNPGAEDGIVSWADYDTGLGGGTGGTGGGSAGSGHFTYGPTAPTTPSPADVWIDSTSGIEYVYVNDGNSLQWVEF